MFPSNKAQVYCTKFYNLNILNRDLWTPCRILWNIFMDRELHPVRDLLPVSQKGPQDINGAHHDQLWTVPIQYHLLSL